MGTQEMQYTMPPKTGLTIMAVALGAALCLATPLQAADAPPSKATAAKRTKAAAKPVAQPAGPIEFASQINATVGKSTLLRLPAPVSRVSVGSPDVADVVLLNPREIYLLGKKIGATNLTLWSKSGQSTIVDVAVGMDTASLQGKLREFFPDEKNIKVFAAKDSVVLSGTVSDAIKVDRVVALAEAFAGSKKVINMLSLSSVQQVMLEVKIAEINRTALDKLGLNFSLQNGANFIYGILGGNSGIFTRTLGGANATSATGLSTTLPGIFGTDGTGPGSVNNVSALVDAQKNDGLVKILAEPNIVAISGQEGSFLAGGEILIPVPQGNGTVTMESKLYGVGLRATPTVLDQGRIHLRVQPEVTDLVGFNTVASTGSGGNTVIPTLTTRRVSTAVELREGQSLAIGGLLQNNTRGSINSFPLLGDIPVLGALFRSTEYQQNKTELMIVVTPRLVKPLAPNYTLPTDALKPPSRSDLFLHGKLEGSSESKPATTSDKPEAKPAATQEQPATGFQMK